MTAAHSAEKQYLESVLRWYIIKSACFPLPSAIFLDGSSDDVKLLLVGAAWPSSGGAPFDRLSSITASLHKIEYGR